MDTVKRILIMGATSGIGLELAKLCIAKGWRVGIAGRRAEPLEKLRQSAPSQVVAGCIDVTRESSAADMLQLVENMGGMDIYCHVSGIGAQNPTLDPAVELRTMETNVMGFTRMVTAAYNYFAQRGGGQIAVVSSIAGTKGLGSATAYSASKRLQNTYLDALSQLAHMRKLKITFTDIRPGFVATDLLNKEHHYPMLMPLLPVARKVFRAIERRRRRVIIDWRFAILVFFWRLIPAGLWERMPVRVIENE